MIGELFKMMAGVDIIHVPYRSVAAAMTDLIGGQVHMMFATTAASVEYVKAGKLRALAVTSAMRANRYRIPQPWTNRCVVSRAVRGTA